MRGVTGVGINDQLRFGDVLRERERNDGRNHDVPISVHDQRPLGDAPEFGKSFSSHLAPFGGCLDLGRHRLRGTWWIDIVRAQVALLLRAAGAQRLKPLENDNRVTVLSLARAALAGIFGRSMWKYLSTNRPSRPLSGPPQLRHTSWPDTDAASASAR